MLNPNVFEKFVEQEELRNGINEALIEAGGLYGNLVVLTADLTESTRVKGFRDNFPNRFINVGVAEQNLASISAGIALTGKTVVMSSYGTFNPGRNWEQIRISICYSNANVKILGGHVGLSSNLQGYSHQAVEDIALTRVLPNMVVLSPCDYYEAKKAVLEAIKYKGPVYIRYTKDKCPILTTKDSEFQIGKAQILKEGKDLTIIGTGPVLFEALLADKKTKNVDCEIINLSSIKPLDKDTILKSAKKTKKVITVEEHQIDGGMGSAICELLSQEYPVTVKRLGIPNIHTKSGTYAELKYEFGIDSTHITKVISEFN